MQLVLQRGVRCNVTHFDSDAGEREGEGGMLLGVSLPAAAPPPMLQCYDAPMLRSYNATNNAPPSIHSAAMHCRNCVAVDCNGENLH